ncbi:hypothetical protein NliqN6_2619 [Naganishia liquefaciens]|uniref:BZIP domain-containing protein n=1 Tax=Naganishia liquefaciens TaxID=104408 RepID=A0A8H3YFH6_9TREE|nr:hypothetical protein NliqN6_2619 [Naganishia liquefaciens]
MHLPDHIANLNSYSPPSPPQHPFPNIFGLDGSHSQNQNIDQQGLGPAYQTQSDADAHVDALLARQLELWTHTDFTFDEDIGPFPGLDDFDDACGGSAKATAEKEQKDAVNEDEMDMRDVFEGKVRGMKDSKNVLLDRRREMELEMERQEKAVNRNADAQFPGASGPQLSGDGDHALASANLAAAAAVNGMMPATYPTVPPSTPSTLSSQNLSRHAQMQQPQQSQQHQVNNLESFLSQFYGSNAVSNTNALAPSATQPSPIGQSMGTAQKAQDVPFVQQPQIQAQNATAVTNQALAESLVHLLQGLTGQQNAQTQPQQHCPAPAVVLPQALPESHSFSNVARWIERQDLRETQPPLNNKKEANSVPNERSSQKRPLLTNEPDAQAMYPKKAKFDGQPLAADERQPIESRNMPDFARMPSSTAVSVSGDTRRKNHNHSTPTRADIDLEPKSVPVGKGLVMVEGEIITHEEDKRRRNTAASARFRMKKKEREQALEKHTHILQDRVNELEREMESLRKENGWLRALVINGAPQPLSSPELQRKSLSATAPASTSIAKE